NMERIAQQGGNKQKQIRLSSFDEDIIAHVKQSLALDEVDVLHPSLMNQVFRPFWRREASFDLVESCTSFEVLPPLDPGLPADGLPDDYIAVKFYGNNSFPESDENRAFVLDTLRRLTEHSDVVLLDTGFRIDDHEQFGNERRDRLHTINRLVVPSNNLEVQTRISSRARAFVGTYGGFSYLAPLQGVSSLAFYSHPDKFLPHHLELANRVFSRMGGSFVALDVADVGLVRLGLES
ncbi:MAG TPA: hypothetical protein VMT52_17400, partial [Planctomycetota bacterium]|nr:hypothetical protein [Planctomycetota bacterium]